eukprot:TRINITY_DN3234_c0_g1_i2.p1 TRINITY_DN3234_c0_g1~~TRINITY_DN3234_c0_g1_i2.p1  ORF type:complete len:159 (-),score=17.15 TRINITY_DN3234_c0_g1_i2:74-550(-)
MCIRDRYMGPMPSLRQIQPHTEENSYGFWTSRSTKTIDNTKRIPITSDYLDYFMANKYGHVNENVRSQATLRTLSKDTELISSSQQNLKVKIKRGESQQKQQESGGFLSHRSGQPYVASRKELEMCGSKLTMMKGAYTQGKDNKNDIGRPSQGVRNKK